jgi:hypothetical protein
MFFSFWVVPATAAAANCNGVAATITGTAADDTLTGTAGNDVIAGLAGNDTIDGAGGNDVICGGLGNDSLTGSLGTDTVSFAESATAVTVNLAAGTATGEGTDTLSGFENAVGSALADKLTGDANPNNLSGLAGADTVDGGGGNDALNGGAAGDTASFATSAAAVTASLTSGTATGSGSDTLAAFENLLGSPFNDNLTGSSAANVIDGGNGNDTLDGSTGTDTVSFASSTAAVNASFATNTATGAGSDSFTNFEKMAGSPKNDVLTGTNLADNLDGSGGNDTCHVADGADTAKNCEIVDGAIETAGVNDVYTFTGTAGKKVFVDMKSPSTSCSSLVWSLTGPGGALFTGIGICSDRGPIAIATTGTYTLTVASQASGTGPYKFQWWTIAAPQVFPYTMGTSVGPNSPTTGQGKIETPQAEDDYTFAGTSGQTLFYDALSGPGDNCNFQRTLVAPNGTVVSALDGGVCSNIGPITLPQTGTYKLRVYAVTNSDQVGTYGFSMTNTTGPQTFAYTIGTTVSNGVPAPGAGNIETVGGEDDYTFTGAVGQKIFYDAISVSGGNCNFHRTLVAPNGTNVAGADGFVCGDVGPITLPQAGTYTLRIYPTLNANDTGTYSFKITNVPALQTFAYTIGNTVSNGVPGAGAGNIETPGAEDNYTFSGTAGQKVFYQSLTAGSGSNCNFHRTFVAPNGTNVAGGDGFVCGNVGPLTLPSTGTYTLRIYGGTNSDQVGTYSFKITNVPASPQTFAYTIGNTVSNGVPAAGAGNIEVPQAEDDYTFTGAVGQKVFYDAISVSGGNCNFHRTLVAPNGTNVAGADGFVCSNVGPISLPQAGTYTLRIYPNVNASDVGTYSFKLVNVPAVQTFAYTIGSTVAPNSPMAGEGWVEALQGEDDYTFSGTAGQMVTYQSLSVSDPLATCNLHRTLYAPGGAIVTGGDGFNCGNTASLTLPTTGTYTLKLYPGANSDQFGKYSFKITSP